MALVSFQKIHPPPPKINPHPIQYSFNPSPPSPRVSSPNSARTSNPRFSRTPASARAKEISPIIPNGPITPNEAKAMYSSLLTAYELTEINDFEEIFYLGMPSKKVKVKPEPGKDNYGFDDSAHHYKAQIGDHLAYRFEIKSIFGKGAFGQVVKCYDHKTKKNVAIKLVINTTQMHEQGRIEVAIIQHLNRQDPDGENSIIKTFDSFIWRNHIACSFEILGPNLYEYSRSIHFKPMTSNQIRSIAKNMLQALAFCHQNNIVHCDMKPENVLLLPNSNMHCKVIDFGSGCLIGHQKYEYIQSRFYRAPEVILGIKYGPPMDIWSFACIIVEMLIGRPLFPGENEPETLEMMMEIFGVPPKSMIDCCKRRSCYFDQNGNPLQRSKVKKHRKPGSLNLRAVTKFSDPILIDFLERCFTWEQEKRMTAQEALSHPWFSVVKTIRKSSRAFSARPSSKILPGLTRNRYVD